MPVKGRLDLDRFAEALANVGPRRLRAVDMTGIGEAFLHKGWDRALKMIRDRFPDATLSMNTNAILLDVDKFKRMLEIGIDNLTISLNGTSRERYRAINQADHFDTLVATIHEIEAYYRSQSHHPMQVVVQVLDTVNSPEEIATFLEWIGIADDSAVTFSVHPYGNWGGVIFNYSCSDCYPCIHLYVPEVSYEGDVYACCVAHAVHDKEFLIGNLFKDRFDDMYKGAVFQGLHEANMNGTIHKKAHLCSTCNH
ncbi:MAG: Radical SAM domain-containing protein [Rhodospirillaceae bacterium]|nr:MAG: Radical SAM domain-containing protein [Rhodospirillaceae bacterium]